MVWPQNVLLTTKKLGGNRNLAGGPKEVIEGQQTLKVCKISKTSDISQTQKVQHFKYLQNFRNAKNLKNAKFQ